MSRRKSFFVYQMQPVKDGTQSPIQAARTTSEDDSGSTPVGTAPPSEPSTATGPSTMTGASATIGLAGAPTPRFGISMVQGPPIILGLSDEPSESSGRSSRGSVTFAESVLAHAAASTTALAGRSTAVGSSHSRYTAAGTSGRNGGYYGTTQITMQQDNEESSQHSSLNSLDREVQYYVRGRDGAIYDIYPGVERTNYDYILERNDMYNTNLVEATAHLIKGSLGVSLLSLHEAYKIGGLWTSLIVTVVFGVLVAYTMLMLIRSAQKLYRRLRINRLSYPDLVEAAAATAPWNWVRGKSKTFRYTVEIILFLQMCGVCCIYHIVIAHTIREIVESFKVDVSGWLVDIRIYIMITSPMLLPLCLIRNLKLLAPFAMLADIFTALCVFATMYFSLSLALHVTLEERAAWKSLHGFISICGISMYGTSGINLALPVENNMKQPKYFPRVVKFATTVVITLTAATGAFGYWAWGESCRSPITVHMPQNAFTTVLQCLLVMMLSTTFAINFWVPFRIIWYYVVKKHKRNHPWRERLYRFFMAILVMCAAMIAPHTIPLMIFFGQFFVGFIALVFPAFIEFFVDWEDQYASRARVRLCNNTKNFGLVVLGLFLSVSTIYSISDHY